MTNLVQKHFLGSWAALHCKTQGRSGAHMIIVYLLAAASGILKGHHSNTTEELESDTTNDVER